jgi:hypothetical protein
MKKLLHLLLLLPFLTLAQSKTFSGTIRELGSNQPIEMVSIGVENFNIGTVTNEEGKFRITIPSEAKTLLFSHLNYKVASYDLASGKVDFEFFLEPAGFDLEEIVITSKPVDKIFSDVLNASKKRLEKSLLIHTYGREFISLNGKVVKFSDGLLDYYIKRKSGASDLFIKQSRTFKVNEKENKSDLESRKEAMAFYDITEAMEDAYDFKAIKTLANTKEYDFELRVKKDNAGNELEIIKIIPKLEVEKDLYMGSITYDSKTKLILEIDLKKSPEHQKYSKLYNLLIVKMKINEFAKKINFKLDGDKYVMTYSQTRMNFYVKTKNTFDDTFEFVNDFVMMDYKEGEFDFDRKTRYKKKGLFEAGNNFQDEYWRTSNIMLLTSKEEKIIKSFE